jgi:ATPase subunit of ABC transporter with duplicated ATPase domains
MDDSATVLEAVLSADTPTMAAVREYEKAAAGMACAGDAKSDKKFQTAMEKMDALQAWDVASDARQLLEVLGVGFFDQRVRQEGRKGGPKRY